MPVTRSKRRTPKQKCNCCTLFSCSTWANAAASICLCLPRARWSRTEVRSDCLQNHYARGGEDGHPTRHLLAKGQLIWVFLRALISSPKLGCPVSPGVARSVSSQARLRSAKKHCRSTCDTHETKRRRPCFTVWRHSYYRGRSSACAGRGGRR